MQCSGQIDGAQVARDRAGLFDDERYIRRAGLSAPGRQNVSLLAPSVTASMLAQFVSLTVAPGGLGAPDPLRFSVSSHTLEHMPAETLAGCAYEQMLCFGNRRPDLTGPHHAAEQARLLQDAGARTAHVRIGRAIQSAAERALDATRQILRLSSPIKILRPERLAR